MWRKRFRLSKPIKVILALMVLALVFAPMIPHWHEQWKRHRQEELDRRLISAIRTHDLKSALSALQSGADANAWEQDDVACPILLTFVQPEHSISDPISDPVPLLREWSDEEAFTLIKALLDHGAEISPSDLRSPLWYVAKEEGHERTMGLLLMRGAAPNQADFEGKTPLFVASSNEKAELLLRYGADIQARDNHQNTPLLHAADAQNAARVRLLCQHGADVTAKNDEGFTALHFIALLDNGDVESVSLLLEAGADINAQNWCGDTPLYDASRYNTEVVRLLLQHHANPNIRNKHGDTPLDEALRFERHQIIKLLRQAGAKTGKELSSQSTTSPKP